MYFLVSQFLTSLSIKYNYYCFLICSRNISNGHRTDLGQYSPVQIEKAVIIALILYYLTKEKNIQKTVTGLELTIT